MIESQTNTNKKVTYNTWAFILLLCIILLSIISYSIITNYSYNLFDDTDVMLSILNIISTIDYVLLLTGIILIVLSIVKKQQKNYLFYINIIGYPILLLQTILVAVQNM